MEPVRVIKGTMAPLPRASVDTDQIIPQQFLKHIERTGFGEFLFHDWAHDAAGRKDPTFVLNRREHRDATVLVAGPDFGTGSSREHAAWALADWGIAAVVAPSFGDIFRTNCHKSGLLAVAVPPPAVEALLRLAASQPDAAVTVDLQNQRLRAAGVDEFFQIEPYAKRMLLNGWDDIDVTLRNEAAISTFEKERPSFKPQT